MTLRVPDEMQDELMKFARKQGLTRNALVLYILRNWLKSKKL